MPGSVLGMSAQWTLTRPAGGAGAPGEVIGVGELGSDVEDGAAVGLGVSLEVVTVELSFGAVASSTVAGRGRVGGAWWIILTV